MKISASGEHSWHGRFKICPEVWLDGVQLWAVVEADDEAGYLIQCKFDSHGNYVHDGAGNFATVRREGTVEFRSRVPSPNSEENAA